MIRKATGAAFMAAGVVGLTLTGVALVAGIDPIAVTVAGVKHVVPIIALLALLPLNAATLVAGLRAYGGHGGRLMMVCSLIWAVIGLWLLAVDSDLSILVLALIGLALSSTLMGRRDVLRP